MIKLGYINIDVTDSYLYLVEFGDDEQYYVTRGKGNFVPKIKKRVLYEYTK